MIALALHMSAFLGCLAQNGKASLNQRVASPARGATACMVAHKTTLFTGSGWRIGLPQQLPTRGQERSAQPLLSPDCGQVRQALLEVRMAFCQLSLDARTKASCAYGPFLKNRG